MSVTCPKCHTDNPDTLKFCGECGTRLVPSSKQIQPEGTETLQAPVREPTTGSTFAGRYQIIEELGKGGMGKVYRVLDKKLGEEVALKLIKPDVASNKETIERFGNELKLARKIGHRNVGRMYELLEDRGTHFITMEYVQGEDLKSFIRRSRQLTVGTAIAIAKQVCEGLAEAHRLGVIHRDLKPSNVMIDKEGNARIMDFGIARSLKGKGITGAGVMIGTPEYMSPEQVEGKEVDQRSDIYSLGIILYEMVTGRVPFEGDTPLAIAVKQKTEAPRDPELVNPQVPKELSHIILECLEKDRAKRYQSVEDVVSDLERIEKGKTVSAQAAEWKNSIAVLPFKNMSADPEQEYFCEGIAEELLNALTQVRELRVAARTSAFSFKGKDMDIREIGRTLNVDKVLEGSVRKSGQRLRITAQLVNVEDGYRVWSDQFDREIKDIFDIQEEISLIIVDKLKLNLLKEEKDKILKRPTEDHEAYDYYLKGRYFWYRRYEKGMQRALQYFEQAIGKDPGYALAHVGIADAFNFLGTFSFMPPHQTHSRAKAAARNALEIDPELAEAYASLSWIALWYDWDWPAAERYSLRALQMKQDYAPAHMWYGNCLWCTGRFDESVREMEKACELEPLEPLGPTQVGLALYMAGRFDASMAELRKAIESDPEFSVAYWYQSFNLLSKKMWGEAIPTIQKFVELSAESVIGLSTLGLAYGLAGMRDDAFKVHERLDALSKDRYVGSLWRALVWLGLGENNKALENLEKAYLEREPIMACLKVWPILDSLRSEPRFRALLKKMNLE